MAYLAIFDDNGNEPTYLRLINRPTLAKSLMSLIDAILKPSNEGGSKDEGDINSDGENCSEELKMASTGKKEYKVSGKGITVLPSSLEARVRY